MIRPRPARWFEALVACDDCTLLLESLGRAGCVELEARASATLPPPWRDLEPWIRRFAAFAARYASWWPRDGLVAARLPEPPLRTLERGNAVLTAWSVEAEPLIRELETLGTEQAELLCWRELLTRLEAEGVDIAALAGAGPLAGALVIEACPEAGARDVDGTLLRRPLPGRPCFEVLVGDAAALERAAREATLQHAQVHPVPAWISGEPGRDASAIEARLAATDRRRAELGDALEACSHRHALRGALAALRRVQWVHDNVRSLEAGERLAWITGWTSDVDGKQLELAIRRSGARALLHFADPPRGLEAPLLLVNPAWARPFELFPRALGVPGRDEADPTLLLAVVVPVLFGYMFADVGQGLLIAVLAWCLRRRTPVARLLVTGGLAASAAGFVFGSVFSMHALVPPLWVDPLAQPVRVLAVPVAGGALFLGSGLLLHALGSWWRGELARMLGEDLGLLAVYAGLLAWPWWPAAPWLAGGGALACVAGNVLQAGDRGALAEGIGLLLERALQLMINTLSFARVGAFALAHAGLSAALVALAGQFDSLPARVLVFVAGNVVVIVLETLVVSIQATRLVLFEFFARFLTGIGRPFRPLPPPPSLVQE